VIERPNEDVADHLEPAAQVVPERDAELVAGLGKTQQRITAIAANIAVNSLAIMTP
jgi:hypothetical protein